MFGIGCPFPVSFGGEQQLTIKTWLALRAAVGGKVGLAGPELGFEDSWRLAKAYGLAAASVEMERAFCEFFPHLATDMLTVYEDVTKTIAAGSNQERRNAAALAWTSSPSARIPDLSTKLPQHFYQLLPDRISTRDVAAGKSFGEQGGVPSYGTTRTSTDWPNFTDSYIAVIVWDSVTSGVPIPDSNLLQTVADLLTVSLPAWCDWRIQDIATEFLLDGGPDGTSLLDWTPL